MLLQATSPLTAAERPGSSSRAASLRTGAKARKLRVCRDGLSGVELEVDGRVVDLERLLAECEGYLVDGPEGEEIGVVEDVELDGPGGTVSALIVAGGWFGRRRVLVEATAIEALVPAERRIVVRRAAPARGRNA